MQVMQCDVQFKTSRLLPVFVFCFAGLCVCTADGGQDLSAVETWGCCCEFASGRPEHVAIVCCSEGQYHRVDWTVG